MKHAMFAAAAAGAAAVAMLAAAPVAAKRPLTRDMAKAHIDFMFAIADANHDGVLTRDEFDASVKAMNGDPQRGGMMFDEADTARSGRLTLAEIEASSLAKFDRADTNHDGVIDDQERQAAKAAGLSAAPPGAPPPRR